MTQAKKIETICPTCKKKSIYDISNLFRPFCSQRCKLIDLGQWADEGFVVPGPTVPPQEDID